MSADGADADVATLLGIRAGGPVLYFDRLSFSGDVPVERSQSWYRSDRYRLQMQVASGASDA